MKKWAFSISAVLVILMCSGLYTTEQSTWDDSTRLAQVLHAMGDPIPTHFREHLDPELIRMGKELVYEGRATRENGSKSNFISKYYVCTDCHNQVAEDPVLNDPNPENRLLHAIKNDLPFLQATTFWGMSNRTSWYNDDYYKKYGSLVDKARNSLEESTQLCAKECSSGRHLEEWELESILHYYGSIDIKLGDLNLTESDWRKIRILAGSELDRKELGSWLRGKIMTVSPATFMDYQEYTPPAASTEDQAYTTGEAIYELSCQTCHRKYGPSQWVLDKSRSDFKRFRKNLGKHTMFDPGYITRKGTKAEPGHMQYMPHYTAERLSEHQMNSLVFYMLNWKK